MEFDVANVRKCLKSFDFNTIFREHLGWDRHQAQLEIPLDSETIRLAAVARKRGFVAYVCSSIPDRSLRLKIDHQVTKSAREHFVIYMDQAAGQQVWHWARREPGKPIASRDHRFDVSTTGDALIQRLDRIAVGLEEEEGLALPDVTGKAKAALDVDKITKKFYARFKAEHAAFMRFIKGIKAQGDLEWYTSLMLNRLMFVYFIQKKGFLAGDTDYLQNRMRQVRAIKGNDKFLTFYRYFLVRLFHDGLGKLKDDRQLERELETLIGEVPYLNGGFFEVHPIEERNTGIDIPDRAFEKLFAFFDEFAWHLDERPLRSGNEINPDVVGYIFEKYINQKQMGAYYTKEDITEYISKNTVIPFLFDAAQKKCPIAFKPEGYLWRLLRDDPDRYLYTAVRRGVIDAEGNVIPLPDEIAAGIGDVSMRGNWNRPAPEPFALPTESWREHVARRTRCLEVREKLRRGEVHAINDLVTLNLDIWQFARDAIVNSEGPELLLAFWQPMQQLTVLDPTCGSGAFLFAALRILETLYSDCLCRMEQFIEDHDALARGVTKANDSDSLTHSASKKGGPRCQKFADFRYVLAQLAKHPSDRYFILKSIIINNLFGVDIMEEAVEICKLRLLLKLVAQVDTAKQIEQLPDIDFNIRAGNTLVGYVTLDAIRKSQEGKHGYLASGVQRIEEEALTVEKCFHQFRARQTKHGGKVKTKDKQEHRRRLAKLDDELDRYLAGEYGVDCEKRKRFAAWKASNLPFHWFVEFYGIMRHGGFDVIIGNPPYVELSDVADDYQVKGLKLVPTGNLFALCLERCEQLNRIDGYLGVITPISAVSTPRMMPLMKLMARSFAPLHISNFAVRPGKLFTGVDMNLSILLGRKAAFQVEKQPLLSTRYNRWQEAYRPMLFETLHYYAPTLDNHVSGIPKLGTEAAAALLARIRSFPRLNEFLAPEAIGEHVYYHSGGRYFRKCIREKLSNEYKELSITRGMGDAVICLLSSSLYYWFWIAVSDCYHVTKRDVHSMPVPPSLVEDMQLHVLSAKLLRDLEKNARVRLRTRADGSQQKEVNFRVGMSRPVLDEIDYVLARHYLLSDEQLDWLLGFDAKYRASESAE